MPTPFEPQSRRRILLWAALPAALTIFLLALIYRAAVTVPFSDEQQFRVLYSFLVNGQMPPLSELLASHNGHPYLLLKLIISCIFLVGLPWKLLMYVQPLFLAWCFYITVRSARLDTRKWQDALIYVALACAIITPRMWEDLYWGMQMSAEMCLAFTLLAFASVARYAQTRSTRDLGVTLLAAYAASVSAGAGILAPPMVVVIMFMLPGQRNITHLAVASVFLVISTCLTILSFELSKEPGMGRATLNAAMAVEHAIRMLAHLYYSFDVKSRFAPWMGLATLLIVAFVTLFSVRRWPEHIFALLCIALGLALIAMITYARVKAGLFQPNAPRYVPAVLPLSIGLLLLLRSMDLKLLLIGMSVVACLGFIKDARWEWRITPDRKIFMQNKRNELCVENKASFSYITKDQTQVLQTLFCKAPP